MKLPERLKNTMTWFNSLDRNTLSYARYGLFVVIVGDLIGLWYFLRLKALSMAIMMVSMGLLALILLREDKLIEEERNTRFLKGGKNNGKQKEEVKKIKKKEEVTSISDFLNSTLEQAGLPDSDEYQKRLGKVLGA